MGGEGCVDPGVDSVEAPRQGFCSAAEPGGDPGPLRLEAGEDAVADTVPREPLVGVRGVLSPGNPLRPEEVPELPSPEGEEGPDDAVGPPGTDAAPGTAEPPFEVEEDRLGLVFQGVPGRQERPGPEVASERQERLVPEPSGRGFQAFPRAAKLAHREAPKDEGEAERSGEVRRGAGVPVALGSAQLVIDVETEERDAPELHLPGEEDEQGGGIAPTRTGGDEGRRTIQEAGRREVTGEGVAKGTWPRRTGGGVVRHPRMVGETGPLVRVGGDGRTRTADTGLMRPPLYRLSYIATSRPQSREWYQTREL